MHVCMSVCMYVCLLYTIVLDLLHHLLFTCICQSIYYYFHILITCAYPHRHSLYLSRRHVITEPCTISILISITVVIENRIRHSLSLSVSVSLLL